MRRYKKRNHAGLGDVIKNTNNEYLLTQRGEGKLFGKWEFPGGKIEEGEHYSDAIRRELLEELNIIVNPGTLLFNDVFSINGKYYNLLFIECIIESGDIILNEHINFGWFRGSQIKELDVLEGD